MPTFHLVPGAPQPVAPYSHAVEAGSFVFVTGQLATDPDDDSLPVPSGIEAQTHKVMNLVVDLLYAWLDPRIRVSPAKP